MATVRRGRAVISPNLGLYLGMAPLLVPERGMSACRNVRVVQNRVVRDNLGWSPFPNANDAFNLDGKPVLLIDGFLRRGGEPETVFGNTTDLFRYNTAGEVLQYLTPRVEAGTVSVTNGSTTVTGSGTSWSDDLKPGDFIHVGETGQRDPSAVWYLIANVVSNTEITLSEGYAEATASGASYTARSTFSGDLRTPFDTEVFYNAFDVQGTDGDRWYATNGVDPVVAWDGLSSQVYRPNLGDLVAAKAVRRYKNTLFFIGLMRESGSFPYNVRTSAIGSPENVVSAEAAEFIVHDGSDELLTAAPVGELLAIYGDRSITMVQFVGPPLMFVFRAAVAGFGPRSSRAVALFPDHHLFIGADSQYAFDGVAARPVNGHVWRELIRQMSPQRLDMIQAHFDEERGELLWSVPLNTDPDPDDGPPQTAVTHHYLEQVGQNNPPPHTMRDLPAITFGFFDRPGTLTWDQIEERWEDFNFRWNDQFLQAAFPQILFGDDKGNIFLLNESTTAAGTPLNSFVRFSRRPLGNNPTQKGTVRRVYPFIEHLPAADYSIRIRLRLASRADEPSSLATSQQFSVSTAPSNHFVSPRITGRYVEVEIGTEQTTDYWAVTGYDLDVVDAGER